MEDPVTAAMNRIAAAYRGRVLYFVGRDVEEALLDDGEDRRPLSLSEANAEKAVMEERIAAQGANDDRPVRLWALHA